jgi:hypothetical protein
MEIKPVKLAGKPNYPLKTELNKEELKKQIPKRWAQSPAARIALGTLAVVSLAGCTADGKLTPPSAVTKEASPSPTEEYILMGEPLAPMINVAPLFRHGNGSGAFGCMMVAPPAFLSEDEALTAVNDTAKEYGLKFTVGDGPVFGNVLKPVTHMYGSGEKAPDTLIEFAPDFTDAEHGISIEYVSTNDVRNWNQGEQTISAGNYDTLDAAAQLSEALESAAPRGSYNVGVLYDPCAYVEPEDYSDRKEQEEAAAKAREMSEEQLKAQAKDFFEWLKQQGVI